MYVALGGSNTCGHGLQNKRDSYMHLISRLLKKPLMNSCTPATPPVFANKCVDMFVPNNTLYATVEFTPNIARRRKDHYDALDNLIKMLLSRSIKTVIVNINTPPFDAFKNNEIVKIATCNKVKVVTVNCTTSPDLFNYNHLNKLGHNMVASRVSAHYMKQNEPIENLVIRNMRIPSIKCFPSSKMHNLCSNTIGFRKTILGYESRNGSSITCVSFPFVRDHSLATKLTVIKFQQNGCQENCSGSSYVVNTYDPTNSSQ